jgi:hypothetical protein
MSDKTSINDITGDKIKTKSVTQKFEDNYGKIDFSIKWDPEQPKKDDEAAKDSD